MKGQASRSPIMNVMFRTIEKISPILRRDFGELQNLQNSQKSPKSFLNASIKKVHEAMTQDLSKARPDYGLLWTLSEDFPEKEELEKEYCWLIHPLDGLNNFLHGIPHFSLSLCLLENKIPVSALIYDLAKNEIFTAQKGQGAYMNQHRIRVSSRRQLIDSNLSTCLAHTEPLTKKIHSLILSQKINHLMFSSPCLDLAYVASGRLDACFICPTPFLNLAAGHLIVQESGGYICDFDGKKINIDSKSHLATNQNLQNDLINMIKSQ